MISLRLCIAIVVIAFSELASAGTELRAIALKQCLVNPLPTTTAAQDRFGAGVATNIEVVLAQEAAVSAREAYIAALYAHNLAKAVLARTIGVDERNFISFLGGQPPWQTPR